MNRKQDPAALLKRLPTKWAVALIVALIAYTFLQPVLTQRLGLPLPPLASLLGQETADNVAGRDKSANSPKAESENRAGQGTSSSSPKPSEKTQASQNTDSRVSTKPPTKATGQGDLGSQGLRYGLLREVGKEDYLSPGGLRYTRGSAEGHRLKHLERHLEDQPNRPGSHGVFDGDMPQVIRWLDDAFERAVRGDKGTSKKKEDRRVVYEARFERPIGYVGGKTGKRKGNPDALSIRLVVEGNRVITAFPF